MADIVIKSPEDYVTTYYTKLQKDLNRYDIQINKLGTIGFFLNMMGYTYHDCITYYNYLFKEGFVATSSDDSNLYMHSSIYGYNPGFATPATASGRFIFDFSYLPEKPVGVYKREVIYKNIMFSVNGHTFTTDSEYRFIEDNSNYYCMIYTPDNNVQYVTSTSSSIEAPFISVKQYSKRNISGTIQSYDYSTYYPYQFDINSGYLYDLNVNVETSTGVWEPFDIKRIKYLEDSFSKIVFLKPLSSKTYLLEFGSGVYGTYVPNCNMKLSVLETDGVDGNINITNNIKLTNSIQNPIDYSQYTEVDGIQIDNSKVICLARQTTLDGNEQSFISENVRDILTVSFEYSEGGSNQRTGYLLRQDIVKYIQSRDNLISESDYYNIMDKYLNDFKFIFKKTSFINNIFYLFRMFRNKYQLPSYGLTYTQTRISSESSPVIKSTIISDDNSTLKPGTYYYYVRSSDSFMESNKSNELSVIVNDDNKSVQLSWDNVENATKYIIYKKYNNTFYEYWESYDCTFVDNGLSGVISYPLNTDEPVIHYPTLKINNEEFISPFVYKYDKYFNWFKGYILYESLIANMSILEKTTISQYAYDVPVFYFNLVYDFNSRCTFIYVKSHQTIKDYLIYLSINELNLSDILLDNIDDNTFVYKYINNDYGFIEKEITLELNANKYDNNTLIHLVTGKAENIRQTIDISDQLKLSIYDNNIINIPLISKNVYDQDVGYYLDKIQEMLSSNNLQENRMITDEVQFRFLNNFNIENFYLKQIITQDYNFDLLLPLKLYVICKIDSEYLKENNVDLSAEKDNLYLELANKLQVSYSGTFIKMYNSQFTDSIYNNRPYIKDIIIKVTDSQDNIITDGLESNTDYDILMNIQKNSSIEDKKINIINYCPVSWWWNIDNINIKFLF